jgi:hypothetical protein
MKYQVYQWPLGTLSPGWYFHAGMADGEKLIALSSAISARQLRHPKEKYRVQFSESFDVLVWRTA